MKQSGKTRVTLKDIAAYCGYSVNTVSRAIRGDEKLPLATRARIRQAADEMGYIRNSNASALRSGSSGIVALIVNDMRNPHFSAMLDKMEKKLREAGYNTMTLCTHVDEKRGEEMIHIAVSHSVDGILYFPYSHDRECIGYMHRCGVPFVLIDHWIHGVLADTARTDDELGGYLAGQHLLQLGHTRFIYMAGVPSNSSQIDRQAGFLRALREKQVPPENVRIIDWRAIDAAVAEQATPGLLLPTEATAVLCFNDTTAYHVINELRAKGIRVPEDLSVLGFDHIRRHFPYMPPLSSISTAGGSSVPETAVQLLLNRIHAPALDPQIVVLPVQIFHDGTTAPPRDAPAVLTLPSGGDGKDSTPCAF